MNNVIENRLSTYKTIVLVLDKHLAIIQLVPALYTVYLLFKAAVNELDEMIKLQIRKISGITEDKNIAREKLSTLLLSVSGILKVFASDNSDMELYKASHYSASSLRLMRNQNFAKVAAIIFDNVTARQTQLQSYGLNTQLMNDFSAAYSDFLIKNEEPDEARRMRKVYTHEIATLDLKVRQILKLKLDNAVQALSVANPLLLRKYKAARRIYDYSSGRKKEILEENLPAILSGTITDSDGLPLSDVLVRIEGTTINTTSDLDGEFLLEVPAGKYNIFAELDGYTAAHESNFKISSGDDLVKDFTLEPKP